MRIRKNSKLFKYVAERAYKMYCYSLPNDFRGEPCGEQGKSPQDIIEYYMESKGTYLSKSGVYYILHVNSNLWFRFEADMRSFKD